MGLFHTSAFTKTACCYLLFLSTDDSLDYQSSSGTKCRIFPSTDKASQQMEGTTVDPEGIPDDLIISFLNAVADQKC